MIFIYILKCENDKYYIGKTKNPNFRLQQHFNCNGSQWTKMYKPIEIIELIPNCDNYDEDKYTQIYMDKFGLNNVRGGSFVQFELDQSTINFLLQMRNGAQDKCFICSEYGHFAKQCKQNIKKKFINDDESCDCITSYFSGHRKSKCLLLNTLKLF